MFHVGIITFIIYCLFINDENQYYVRFKFSYNLKRKYIRNMFCNFKFNKNFIFVVYIIYN